MKLYLTILFISISCLSCSYKISPPNRDKYTLADTVFFRVTDRKQKIDSVYVTSNNKLIKNSYTQKKYFVLTNTLNPGANRFTINTVLKSGKTIKNISNLFITSDIVPKKYFVRKVESLPHDTSAFTQGLVFHKNLLYESTGIKGKSRLRLINPENGVCIKDVTTDTNLFNEGITIINDTLYQLTWKDSVIIVRNIDFSIIKKKQFPAEGWGLCSNNNTLYFSDGSNRIIKMNPHSMEFTDTLKVIDNNGPLYYINEMEWINNYIWANIYGKDNISIIDPVSGKVIATVHIDSLIDREHYSKAGVMNGIAYDTISKKVYLTGKNWPFIKVCHPDFGE